MRWWGVEYRHYDKLIAARADGKYGVQFEEAWGQRCGLRRRRRRPAGAAAEAGGVEGSPSGALVRADAG